MPRYYFHLHRPQEQLRDEEGLVLPDAEAAWFHAVRSAREIIHSDRQFGFPYDEQLIEIADEEGAPVEQLPLEEIARYAV